MTKTETTPVVHETTVHETHSIYWTCTCGERGQSYHRQYAYAVRASAFYHERNNNA